MTNNNIILIFGGILSGLLLIIIIAYVMIQKSMTKAESKHIKQLREGTKEKNFSLDVIYQKLYIIYSNLPFLKRYIKKLRRKLEIINIADEYLLLY